MAADRSWMGRGWLESDEDGGKEDEEGEEAEEEGAGSPRRRTWKRKNESIRVARRPGHRLPSA